MLNKYSLLIVECDEPEEFDDCWGESIVQFELDENIDDAMNMIIAEGWTITEKDDGEYICICPFCGEGEIKKQRLGLVKKENK